MHPKTTIHDIAKALNVNAATVSRALNDHPAISAKTKTAVRKEAKRQHYQPNRIASSLRSGRSKIIGVIIPSAEINFFGSVLHGIEKVANEHGYTIIIYQSNESAEWERKGIETLLRSRVDGVIVSIAKNSISLEHFKNLKERGTPLLFFDRSCDEVGAPSVTVDDYKGAYLATEHLIQQGYRNIAYIAGQKHVAIWQQRLQGYKDALRAAGMPIKPEYIVHGDVSVDSGKACMAKLLSLSTKPGAICCVEDFTALGALQLLKERGVNVPGEMGVIGFANEAFGAYLTPSLSTVDQQTIRMGEEVAKLFFELAAKDDFYGAEKKIVLEPVLIIRESSSKS
ncbi:MAG: LacI family transcriptional regulator [Flaviaesturariibacter sp.]|nr:LacI family transcriptional regulator [Flaviaesturariibacter sp.]